MTHAKKDPARAREISEKGKSNSKVNRKNIPSSAKAGERGEQRKKGVRRKKKEGITWKFQKKYVQQKIPFGTSGYASTTGQPTYPVGIDSTGGTIGIRLEAGRSADGENQKGKERPAAEDQ